MTAVSSASTQQNSKINEYKKPQEIKSKKNSGSTSTASASNKKTKTSVFTKQQEAKQKAAAENKALGLVNTKGAGTKVKSKSGNTYTVVGNATNGRKIVKDSNGQTQVLAADGTLLNKNWVKSNVQKTNQAAAAKKSKEQTELKSLGLTNTNGAGTKVKSKSGNVFTVVGNATNGRKIVKDAKGQTQVLAADGTLLKKEFVQRDVKSRVVATNSKSAQQAALETMNTQLKTAQKAFQHQLSQDGWAADVADGISNIWGAFQENGNQAWRVRRDLQTYTQNMQALQKAAKQGDAAFNAKFKQIYGKDFDQKAMAEYTKNPTAANYQKAFGTKNNIKTRVDNYNSSQQTGAEAVKTTTKIGAGVIIGIATGGTGLVALGTTALATGAASLVIDETDRLKVTDAVTKGKVNFREGTDHKKILTSAAFDGVSVLAGGAIGKAAIGVTKGATTFGAKAARLAMNTTGDVVVGAAQEYVETGGVTAGGVISNAAMSAIGGTVVDGTLQGLGKGFSYVKGKIKGGNVDIDINTRKLSDAASDIDLPASGRVKADGDVDLPSVHAKTDVDINPKVSADVDMPIVTDTQTKVMYDKDGNMITGGLFSKSDSKRSFMDRMFGKSTTNTSQISDKKIRQKVNENIAKVHSNDPGTVSVSQKLEQAMNSNAPLIQELGDGINLNNISQYVKSGEVCTVGTGSKQKLYVNNNGTAVELKMSKEKFEELFPKTGFAMVEQKGYNNCWLVSRLNSMTETPSGRAQLYSMLEEMPNGDIKVKLPGSNHPITFSGGKPVDVQDTKLGEGASQGLEMIHQSVLVRVMQGADRSVEDISTLSLSKLREEAGRLAHTDKDATKLLFDKNSVEVKTNLAGASLEDRLQSFTPGQDMGTLAWSAHARSIVDYNPQTKMVTYHDPYYGGMDITCTLDDLKKQAPTIYIVKNKSTDIGETRTSISSKDISTPISTETNPLHNITTPPTTKLTATNQSEIARTADGNPIMAKISGENVIINKNGKETSIPLSVIKENDGILGITETSTGANITFEMDELGNISTKWQLPDNSPVTKPVQTAALTTAEEAVPSTPAQAKKRYVIGDSGNTTADKPTSTAATRTQNQTSVKTAQTTQIPKGFQEHGKIFGKRSIVGTVYGEEAVTLIQTSNGWKIFSGKHKGEIYNP